MNKKSRLVLLIVLVTSLLVSACSLVQYVGEKVFPGGGANEAPEAESPQESIPPTDAPPTEPTFPTYSEILRSYPAGVELSCTDAEVSAVTPDGSWTFTSGLICPGKSQLTVKPGETFTTGETFFGNTWKTYGAKLTLKNAVTIDGISYPAGTLLTVDKELNWVQVSSWK